MTPIPISRHGSPFGTPMGHCSERPTMLIERRRGGAERDPGDQTPKKVPSRSDRGGVWVAAFPGTRDLTLKKAPSRSTRGGVWVAATPWRES